VAYQATQHLLSLGRTAIAMVTGPVEEDCSQDRIRGFRRAMREAGLSVDEDMIMEGDWSASSGEAALLSFAKHGHMPTAVFAQNDRMAMGVLRAARDMKVRVPFQLAVIGVDDMPLSSYFDPPLTTMRQDMAQIGREAAKLLIEAIRNPHTTKQSSLPGELIVRNSTVNNNEEEVS
jgi:DNA-binding LacI/PurR family transcriptional regulator